MEKTYDREPIFVTQLDSDGRPEKVDVTKQSIKVICAEPGCFQVRYVHPQDRYQSEYCKPHARLARLKSRAQRARDKRKLDKATKADTARHTHVSQHLPIMVGGVRTDIYDVGPRPICSVCCTDFPCKVVKAGTLNKT